MKHRESNGSLYILVQREQEESLKQESSLRAITALVKDPLRLSNKNQESEDDEADGEDKVEIAQKEVSAAVFGRTCQKERGRQ
ncbi:hypothetical protein HID58_084422 [Brassica napus]|uniref:Uncharacterized protein n=1 Tax=Brassica napus TaxID=3708 RepID=A0ABQ7XJX2_BRANA|nr:hypothetical protein HID58_084422 [Brassica napus]